MKVSSEEGHDVEAGRFGGKHRKRQRQCKGTILENMLRVFDWHNIGKYVTGI